MAEVRYDALPAGLMLDVVKRLERIEAKLDALIQVLAEDEQPDVERTLDGHPCGAERQEGLPL